jgi:uncharacterized protein
MERGCKRQRCMQAIVVGTDIPDVSAAILVQAAQLLDAHDVVFGPVEDGGYYLVGMKAPQPAVFQDVSWSTSVVLAQSLQKAAAAGLRVAPVHSLPRLRDIDTKQARSPQPPARNHRRHGGVP